MERCGIEAETATSKNEGREREGPLRRTITRRFLLFFVIGDVLGAGIYALVGEVAGEIGGAVWVAFMVALALAVFTAFAYAELVTKYPHAGGAALFVNRAFKLPFLTFMVAFAVMASGVTSASTLAHAFGGDYLKEFIEIPTTLSALVFILLVAAINFRGISESIKVNLVFTLVELTGLVLIVLIGAWVLGSGDADTGRAFEFKQGENVVIAILAGTSLAFYALIGFEDSANVAEETLEPARSYPFALFVGLAVAGVIYLLVTIAASVVVPTKRLSESDGPLLEVVKQGSALPPRLFAAIALLAVANGALINMVMASRLLYGMANESILPHAFARVHSGRRTPWVAIVFTTSLAIILISVGKLDTLAQATVMLLLSVFAVVNVTVLVLRREDVEEPHFVAPNVFPILGALVSVVLLIHLVTQQSRDAFLLVAALLALGVVLWLAARVFSRTEDAAPLAD